jgi:hypothetical protein
MNSVYYCGNFKEITSLFFFCNYSILLTWYYSFLKNTITQYCSYFTHGIRVGTQGGVTASALARASVFCFFGALLVFRGRLCSGRALAACATALDLLWRYVLASRAVKRCSFFGRLVCGRRSILLSDRRTLSLSIHPDPSLFLSTPDRLVLAAVLLEILYLFFF